MINPSLVEANQYNILSSVGLSNGRRFVIDFVYDAGYEASFGLRPTTNGYLNSATLKTATNPFSLATSGSYGGNENAFYAGYDLGQASAEQLYYQLTGSSVYGDIFRRYDSAKLGGLNVKFQFQYTIDNTAATGRISICNLSRDEINALTTWALYNQAYANKKLVRFYAGYGDYYNLIFEGFVKAAQPTTAPDIWIDFDLIQNLEMPTTLIPPLSFKQPTEAIAILQAASGSRYLNRRLDVSVSDPHKLEIKVENFNFIGGTQKQLIEKMRSMIPNHIIYCEGSNTALTVRDAEYDMLHQVGSQQLDWNTWEVPTTGPAPDFYVSELSGMIGVPRMEPRRVFVEMLLFPRVSRRMLFQVRSTRVPSVEPFTWLVDQVTHSGEFRGDEWKTSISGIRIDLPKTSETVTNA